MRAGSPVELEVIPADPRATNLQGAERLAIPRQRGALIVNDAHLDAKKAAAGLGCEIQARIVVEVLEPRLDRVHDAKRARLGHAPALAHLHVMLVTQHLDHRSRHGRSAYDRTLQRMQRLAHLVHVGEKSEPHGRHAETERHSLGLHEAIKGFAVAHFRPG